MASRGSTNTDRVRLTLAESGFTDYEFLLLNLQKGEQKVGEPSLMKDAGACPRVNKLYIPDAAAPSPKRT
jgi:glutathione S-transferase